jgi:hypothetical protein
LVPLACRPLFTPNVIKMAKIWNEWNDVDLNLRSGGATRGKGSIIRWEGLGEECGYSRLQGGSPHLCQLRTVRSGPLNEHLIYGVW